MSAEILNLRDKNPFADENDDGQQSQGPAVHIRIQQRNGRKSVTTVSGLVRVVGKKLEKNDPSLEKTLKHIKKKFACNGHVVSKPDPAKKDELAEVTTQHEKGELTDAQFKAATDPLKEKIIQLQGDQRKHVYAFLTAADGMNIEQGKVFVHGF